MISTKKAFQIMPFLANILDKIHFKEFFAEVSAEQGEEKAGIDFTIFLMKNVDKCMGDVCNAVAILEDKELKAVEEQDVFETLDTLNELFKNEKLMAFFGSAMR